VYVPSLTNHAGSIDMEIPINCWLHSNGTKSARLHYTIKSQSQREIYWNWTQQSGEQNYSFTSMATEENKWTWIKVGYVSNLGIVHKCPQEESHILIRWRNFSLKLISAIINSQDQEPINYLPLNHMMNIMRLVIWCSRNLLHSTANGYMLQALPIRHRIKLHTTRAGSNLCLKLNKASPRYAKTQVSAMKARVRIVCCIVIWVTVLRLKWV